MAWMTVYCFSGHCRGF